MYTTGPFCRFPIAAGQAARTPILARVVTSERCRWLLLSAAVQRGATATPTSRTGGGDPSPVRYRFVWRSANHTVFEISIATVIGPTPPGTGVIAEATSRTAS